MMFSTRRVHWLRSLPRNDAKSGLSCSFSCRNSTGQADRRVFFVSITFIATARRAGVKRSESRSRCAYFSAAIFAASVFAMGECYSTQSQLEAARKKAKMSQAQLVDRLGVNPR